MGSRPVQALASFTFDDESTGELWRMSEETLLPPERLLGMALRMLVITVDAKKAKRKVLITSESGYPIREIFIPGK